MNRNSVTRIIIAFATGAALFCFVFLLQNIFGETAASTASIPVYSSAPKAAVKYGYGKPSRLQIPSISVDAHVQHVGLNARKEMAIPTNFTDVGWYMHGTIPGEVGSAVIDGHVDNALGLPGVFKRLEDVKNGDSIYVIDEKGERIRFKVISNESYNYKDVPVEEIFNESERRLIRLITCGGRWVRAEKTYDARVIVTAEAVE